MKKIKIIVCFIAAFALTYFLHSCSTPADYCEKIVMDCSKLETSVGKLANQISSKDYDKLRKTYDENLEEVNSTLQKLEKVGEYKGENYLQKAAINYAKTYKEIYENEFKVAIEILTKDKKTYEDGEKIAFILDDVTKSSKEAKDNLLDNIAKFVKEYDLNVVE
jgi:hypothetical protein